MAKKHHEKAAAHLKGARDHLDQLEQILTALKGGQEAPDSQPPTTPSGVSPLGGQAS